MPRSRFGLLLFSPLPHGTMPFGAKRPATPIAGALPCPLSAALFRIVGLYFADGVCSSDLLAALVWPWDDPVSSRRRSREKAGAGGFVVSRGHAVPLAVAASGLVTSPAPSPLLGPAPRRFWTDSREIWILLIGRKRRLALQALADLPRPAVRTSSSAGRSGVPRPRASPQHGPCFTKNGCSLAAGSSRDGLLAPLLLHPMRTPVKAAVWDTSSAKPHVPGGYAPFAGMEVSGRAGGAVGRGRCAAGSSKPLRQMADGLNQSQPGQSGGNRGACPRRTGGFVPGRPRHRLDDGHGRRCGRATERARTLRQAGVPIGRAAATTMDRAAGCRKGCHAGRWHRGRRAGAGPLPPAAAAAPAGQSRRCTARTRRPNAGRRRGAGEWRTGPGGHGGVR